MTAEQIALFENISYKLAMMEAKADFLSKFMKKNKLNRKQEKYCYAYFDATFNGIADYEDGFYDSGIDFFTYEEIMEKAKQLNVNVSNDFVEQLNKEVANLAN